MAETTWRQKKIRKIVLAPTTFDRCLSQFDELCRVISVVVVAAVCDRRMLPVRPTPPALTERRYSVLACFALSLEKLAKIRFMGHNKGRDNAKKRAKRRKKHELLASAKQKQPMK